jgi:hypothetical protein
VGACRRAGLAAAFVVLGAIPAAAADKADCLAKHARVANEIVRTGQQDHFIYKFEERAERARQLCESGAIDDAFSLMAEILSDLRIAVRSGHNG